MTGVQTCALPILKLKGSGKEEMKTKKGGKGTIRRSAMVKTEKKL